MEINYCDIKTVYEKIDKRLANSLKTIIAIDGQCGSGKSFFANELLIKYNASVIHMDDFFVPPMLRDEAHELINVHYERFMEEVIDNLKKNEFTYRKFSCKKMDYEGYGLITNNDVLIIEGSYCLAPIFSKYYNISVYTKTTMDKRLERLKKRVRDEEKLTKFKTLWIPKEEAYNDYYKISEKADFIINT